MKKQVRGINILNPVEVDRDYYLKAIQFAIENGYNHIQLNGPIHDFKISNVDGMVMYKKYSNFNHEKNEKYVNYCMEVVNECLEKSHKAGIKTYMWHHELEVPANFMKTYPEIINECGDVEITHPRIKDFLENKFKDFFEAYPLMDGIVITFYESKIPLLRLKNQKLGQQERMEYVTRILYEACKKYDKELIVRTDAPLENDYKVLLKTYENVSTEMLIMDRWVLGDWSLTLPNNPFLKNVDKNPLLIETDIFGEYFGKGRLPLMLKEHIKEKFNFCEKIGPIGYCSRIDRGGYDCFGQINEINLHIMKALLDGDNLEKVINAFFNERYGDFGEIVKSVMEKTEQIIRKTLFANEYYYSELSLFPTLNHCKNHFYFELMKENCDLVSEEWYIPQNYIRGDVQNIFNDLLTASKLANECLDIILSLKSKIEKEKYNELFIKFKNLQLVTKCWIELANVFYNYTKYFELKEKRYEQLLYGAIDKLIMYNQEGKDILGSKFYCLFAEIAGMKSEQEDNISNFISDVKKSFEYEKRITTELERSKLIDYVVCGGGVEGHKLQKEVNFSDTVFVGDELVRIPGNRNGLKWSFINAHGWFSYELKVKPKAKNLVKVVVGGKTDRINFKLIIGKDEHVIDMPNNGKTTIEKEYNACDEQSIRIKVDKISGHTPCVYTISVS